MIDNTICFIVGCGRSGTHYLAQIIDTSEDVYMTYEDPEIFPHVVDHVTLPDKSLMPAIRKYAHYHECKTIYVDKSHPNLFNVQTLLSYFPKAKFIGIYRNVFETVTSMLIHGACANWGARYKELKFPNEFLGLNVRNLERYESAKLAGRCTFRWFSHYSKLRELEAEFNDKFLLMNYRDLIQQNESQTERIGKFLNTRLRSVKPDMSCQAKWKTKLTVGEYEEILSVLDYCEMELSHPLGMRE